MNLLLYFTYFIQPPLSFTKETPQTSQQIINELKINFVVFCPKIKYFQRNNMKGKSVWLESRYLMGTNCITLFKSITKYKMRETP